MFWTIILPFAMLGLLVWHVQRETAKDRDYKQRCADSLDQARDENARRLGYRDHIHQMQVEDAEWAKRKPNPRLYPPTRKTDHLGG